MAGLTPLPPSITHTTTRLTHLEAHTFLNTFLNRAEIDAAYRPDSTLAERGPQALSTGSSPNLTLHHLKRILLGMEGKRVGKQAFEEEAEGQETGAFGEKATKRTRGDDEAQGGRRSKPYTTVLDVEGDAEDSDGPALVVHPEDSSPPTRGGINGTGDDGDDWQEKDTYDLAQSSAGLELTNEDRHPGADLEQPVDDAEEQDLVAVEDERTGERVDPREFGHRSSAGKGKSNVDKEERKRLKKLNAKLEKSKREENRKKGKGKGA
ncbi:hypothetical protein LTR84_000261 [Exophiala bonariae]|uniref:Uncharacterized protein n=1 Tax=Exophiala bonariae TaxID=1690606 RepID=A0AAV9NU30_9EURO|nr:hypothetical protein LTR84_000261 [Exophiala bonariae]